jgi:hypothetical protein
MVTYNFDPDKPKPSLNMSLTREWTGLILSGQFYPQDLPHLCKAFAEGADPWRIRIILNTIKPAHDPDSPRVRIDQFGFESALDLPQFKEIKD